MDCVSARSLAGGCGHYPPDRALPLQKKREKPNHCMTYDQCVRRCHTQYGQNLNTCVKAYRRCMRLFLWTYLGHLVCGGRLAVCKWRTIRDYQMCLQKCLELEDERMARIWRADHGLAQICKYAPTP